MTIQQFAPGYLYSITRRIFTAVGTPRHIAEVVAEVLVHANLTGHDSHGVLRIPSYLRGIEAGWIVPAAEPEVIRETPTTLVIDGRRGFGHYTAREAMRRALEKARRSDVCCVGLVRTGHIGRLGEYAEQAARAGCIGFITTGSGGREGADVVPYGGATGGLGTNPIAVGVPTGDVVPFVLDYATSRIAAGKVSDARSRGLDLPEGSLIDKHGRPTVRPADFDDGGFLLPFGGHKGYALGVLVTLLGGLSGAFDVERRTMAGAFMQAVNIEAFVPLAHYQRAVRALLDGLKATPPAPGFQEVLVPGEPEHRSRTRRLAEGIPVPEDIIRQIREGAEKLGVSFTEEEVEAADVERYRVPPDSPGTSRIPGHVAGEA